MTNISIVFEDILRRMLATMSYVYRSSNHIGIWNTADPSRTGSRDPTVAIIFQNNHIIVRVYVKRHSYEDHTYYYEDIVETLETVRNAVTSEIRTDVRVPNAYRTWAADIIEKYDFADEFNI